MHTAFQKFANNPKNKNLNLEVGHDYKIKLSSHGKEIVLDAKNKTLSGFKNAAGELIQFKNTEELMRVGLFLNTLRADNILWDKNSTDATKKSDPNRPFDLTGGIDQVWKGVESIVFKKHDGAPVVMSNAIPFFSEMDLKFPTIEEGDRRGFFVQYLNQLWKTDHPD